MVTATEQVKAGPFTGLERRVSITLGAIMGLRMLGLFLILPVFTLYADELYGASALLAGVALGIYGLTQALMQIPFGVLSDRIGRKPVIIVGLLIFAAGSLVAAGAETIFGVIAGRALQGAGAIAAVLSALLADFTRPAQRAKAMAILGVSIGGAFGVAIVAGPVLAAWIGLPGIFLLTAALALVVVPVLWLLVPTPPVTSVASESATTGLREALRDPTLLRLDGGIFTLHLILTALFVVLPLILRDVAGVEPARHGLVYLGVMAASVVGMVPLVMRAAQAAQAVAVLRVAIVLLALAAVLLCLSSASFWLLLLALWVFFVGFNTLEATLPALVSRAAPAAGRGGALGVYSASQFLGAFCGGVLGGTLATFTGPNGVFLVVAALALCWLMLGTRLQLRE